MIRRVAIASLVAFVGLMSPAVGAVSAASPDGSWLMR
jgi:hypothetical protein